MPKARAPNGKGKAERPKPPSVDPKQTRGIYWDRMGPPFDAAHSASVATVAAQQQFVGAIAEKLGVDLKKLTRVQLEAFDATVKAAKRLPTDIPSNGETKP